MSSRFPIGVATMYRPKPILFILIFLLFIISCTPINIPTQSEQLKKKDTAESEKILTKKDNKEKNEVINKTTKIEENINLSRTITLLFSSQNNENFIRQFSNVLELAVYNKNLKNVYFELRFFENDEELEKIIKSSKKNGKIYIGPTETKHTKLLKKFCDNKTIFFSFSSDTSLAQDCIYLINFFPKNELEQLFKSLDSQAKVALLYPENNYGYNINILIDDVINMSDAVLVNRASYKNDLSNVRDAIKELGKYELRKFELDRQKKILSTKKDEKSKARLKKLKKFRTTKDYDFTHILIADYGLNLLQVAPLLPYYDIDPNVVQFLSTGVIDDDNFFFEPSLQGTIFPGIEKAKRLDLLIQYKEIYDENMLRISTLPYDLVGLLNYVFSGDLNYKETLDLLNNPRVKFDGVDGKFYFKKNIIERDLEILKISNGLAKKLNRQEIN